MLINSLQNVITNPTRQDAIIDPIVIPDDMHYLDAGIFSILDNISDHKATYVILPFQYNLQGSFTRLVWLYKKANFDLSKEKLSANDWSVLYEGSLDDACSTFTDIFLDMVKLCIPSNLVVVRPNDKPWYDSEIRHFTNKRDKLKRKLINSTSLHLREQYRKLCNKVNNLKKHAKERLYKNLESSISDFYSNNKRQFWSIIRHFVKNNSSTSSIPPLQVLLPNNQNDYCYTDMEKAECLNEYFTSVSSLDDTNCYLPAFELKCQSQLLNISCTASEIQSFIEILNPNTACGPDGISNKMLKPVAKEISVPLSILFNRSFREGKFSELWKRSNIIPLPKKGDNSDQSNFRPVSLLSGIGKIQECIVFKNIYNFLNENNFIYKYQSGFLPNNSTTFQLIDIYHHICQAMDSNQYSCMVFCDVPKAFDRVCGD